MSKREQMLSNARASADAISLLFGRCAEVVVHDLASETIAHIANPYSQRRPCDPSNMTEIDFRPSDTVIGPYEKVNWDGNTLRSISVVWRDEAGVPQFVVCINHDQSDLQALTNAVSALMPLKPAEQKPDTLFRNDWHENLNTFVSEWCRERGLRLDGLGRDDRRLLIAELDKSGALNERNAATYIARLIGVSRATIYNDLKAGSAV